MIDVVRASLATRDVRLFSDTAVFVWFLGWACWNCSLWWMLRGRDRWPRSLIQLVASDVGGVLGWCSGWCDCLIFFAQFCKPPNLGMQAFSANERQVENIFGSIVGLVLGCSDPRHVDLHLPKRPSVLDDHGRVDPSP